jgi:hypothetical protein
MKKSLETLKPLIFSTLKAHTSLKLDGWEVENLEKEEDLSKLWKRHK